MSEHTEKQGIKQYVLSLSWDDIVDEFYDKNQQIKKLKKMVENSQDFIKKLQKQLKEKK